MKHTIISSENFLIEFLKNNNVEAIPANQAEEYRLHWWKREGIAKDVEVAILGGYFFLIVKEENIYLFVHYERDDWYDLVEKWDINVSEDAFVLELKGLIQEDDSHIWSRVRRNKFDAAWDRSTSKMEDTQVISLELKEKIFQFQEGLIDFPVKIKEFKFALIELLTFLANKNILTSTNCLVIHMYFPFDEYERWGLPIEFKLIINKMSKQFYNGNIPQQDVINELLQEAKTLIN